MTTKQIKHLNSGTIKYRELESVNTVIGIEPLVAFDIKPQNIASALIQFGEQAAISVLIQHQARDSKTDGLKGEYNFLHGLEILLAETNLGYRQSDAGIVVYLKVATAAVAQGKKGRQPAVKSWFVKALAVVTSTLALGSGIAMADEESDGESLGGRVLEEIIVTATRRETSLQETALAISVMTGADMARQGIENFEDFARQIPGMILTGAKNYGKFAIRGVSTTTTGSSNGEQKPVAVYIDEVPVSTFSVITPDLRLYDIERVEILRGPQGTSFGSGSMGGAVRVITRKANLEGFDASLRVDGSSIENGGMRQRYSAMVNIPIIEDELALRVVSYFRDEEGYAENVGTWGFDGLDDETDSEEWGGRASIRWQPTEQFSATVMYMHDDIDTTGFDLVNPVLGNNKRAVFLDEETLVTTDSINATLQYEWEWGTLVSSTSYAKMKSDWALDLDAVLTGLMPIGYSEMQRQSAFVQELRLVSTTENSIEWLAGLFYLDRETDFFGSLFTTQAFLDELGVDTSNLKHVQSPGVDMDATLKELENKERAVFAELTYHLSDTLSLTGGVRYTQYKYSDRNTGKGFNSNTIDLIFGSLFGFGGGTAASFSQNPSYMSTGSESSFTKKINLSWQPNDDHMFYVMAAEGFRRDHPNLIAGTPSTIDPNDPTIIPEVGKSDSLWNYELGMKSQWLEGRLQANLSAYYIVWDDIQISATRGSDSSPYTTNAGDAETKGLEAELLAWPNENIQLGLNFTFANSEIVSLSEEDAMLSGAVKGVSLSSPDFQASAFGQYNWELGNGHSLYARMDIQYVGDYNNSLPNLSGSPTMEPNPNHEKIPSYENINAQFGWESDRLSIALYGENILNNDDIHTINPATHTLNRYRSLRPRTIGLRFDWSL